VRVAHGFFSVTQTCPRCRGAGRVITKPCTRCNGEGRIRIQREINVDIPPGVDTGMRVRASGEGEPGDFGGPRGDLHIFIEVAPHEIFTREGNDVICELPISFTQAALGATVNVPTLKKEVELKIPAGSQPDSTHRLRGYGIPDVRGYRTGDQIVRLIVEVPTKLTRRQRELLKEFELEDDSKSYPLYSRFVDRLKKLYE
jgi:molecular chaperone DnaJ